MARLTTPQRNSLAGNAFALPGRRYPIPDAGHARNALARVAQFGTPKAKATVKAKVKATFPAIKVKAGQRFTIGGSR